MKKVLVILLSAVLFASFASAELLTTANPIGQGKWAVLGTGMQDSSQQFAASGVAITGLTITSYGGYVGYGLTDKLDLYINAGSATMGNWPTTVTVPGAGTFPTAGIAASMTSIGLTAKYQLMDEMANSPVSVAVGAGYKSINSSLTNPTAAGGTTSTATGNQMLAGVGVSKIIAPFAPYGGLTYRKSTSAGADVSSQIDLTVGSAIAWSKQGAVFVEYTMQSITPNGGSNYTSGQIALGVGYLI